MPYIINSSFRSRCGPSEPDSRGGILIEFALCLPVLILLIQGITSFGLGFREYAVVVDSIRSAARSAAANRTTASPCTIARQTFQKTMQQYGLDSSRYTLTNKKYRKQIVSTGSSEWFYLLSANRLDPPALGFVFDWVFSRDVSSMFMFEEESQGDNICLTEIAAI